MERDESRDVAVRWDWEYSEMDDKTHTFPADDCCAWDHPERSRKAERYVPHDHLVDLERQNANLRKWFTDAGCDEVQINRIATDEAVEVDAYTTREIAAGLDAAKERADIERKLTEAKSERDAAINEMAKARQKATDCEAARDLTHWILYDRAEEVGGQFKRLYDEWSQMKRQLAESRAATDALDSELTKIRVALTAAGIPEVEPYQEEDVSDWERSLRAGGRVICATDRIKRLAESRAEVERLRGAMLDALNILVAGNEYTAHAIDAMREALEAKP